MKAPRTMDWASLVAAAVLLAVFLGGAGVGILAEEKKAAVEADWPQFLGPNRDGIAPSGPKLLDAWPKEGLKLLWKSDAIPSGWGGGAGSVAVSGGKAFVFMHSGKLKEKEKVLITTQFLKELGWAEGVPDDLAKKIEEARVSDKRRALSGPALDAYIKEFLAALDPEQAKNFGEHIKFRLTQGKEALTWGDFTHLSKARDKEYPNFGELTKAVDNVFSTAHGAPGSNYMLPYFLKPFNERLNTYTDTVICLDAATGKEVWRKEFPGVTSTRPENYVNFPGTCTPAVSGGKVYAAGSAGVYCLSVNDGAVVWQAKAPFSHSSPQILNGVVYFCAGELAAFNADTGKELWRQPQVKCTCSSPHVWICEGKPYVLCTHNAYGFDYDNPQAISCVDAENGKVLWQVGSSIKSMKGVPATAGDFMVVWGNNGAAGFKISPQKAEQVWTVPAGDAAACPVIYQDRVYLCGQTYNSELVFVKDLKTGGNILHQKGPHTTCSTPAVADGKVFMMFATKETTCSLMAFKTTLDKYEVVGEMPDMKVAAYTSPAIAGGKMYVRLVDGVACYDLTGTAK